MTLHYLQCLKTSNSLETFLRLTYLPKYVFIYGRAGPSLLWAAFSGRDKSGVCSSQPRSVSLQSGSHAAERRLCSQAQ